jgi:hypothetical protein
MVVLPDTEGSEVQQVRLSKAINHANPKSYSQGYLNLPLCILVGNFSPNMTLTPIKICDMMA